MTKYICDRCKNEYNVFENNLFRIRLEYINVSRPEKKYDLCHNCINYIIRMIEDMSRPGR